MCSWFLSQIVILSSMILPSSFSNLIMYRIHSFIHLSIDTNSISIFKPEHTQFFLFINTNSISIFKSEHTQFIYSSAQIPFSILKSDHVPNSFSHQHKFHSSSSNLIIYPNSFINTKVPILHLQIWSTHSFIHSWTQIPSPSFSPLVIHHLDFILSMDFHQF